MPRTTPSKRAVAKEKAAAKAEIAAEKAAASEARASASAASVSAKAVAAAVAENVAAGVIDGGAPSAIKPQSVEAVNARAAIPTMSESELDAFEANERYLVRHVPGILGAIKLRRAELGLANDVPGSLGVIAELAKAS